MKLSRKWINEDLVDLSHISDQKLCEALEMLGHKVLSLQQIDGISHDSIIDVEINSNRPDCFSLIGIAREAAAAFDVTRKYHEPDVKGNDKISIYELLDVDVPAEWLCNRYSTRMAKNVKVAPSPKWLRDRLTACGIEPVNNIIDITNYVAIEYGQPVTAYDYRSITSGQLSVRETEEGELFIDSDGKQYTLQAGMLVVCDDTDIISIAGITGTAASKVSDDTTTVVIESASFNSDSIRKTSQVLEIKTSSSIQFEHSPDPMLTVPALHRVCELLEMLQCADVLDGMLDVLNYIPEPRTIELDIDQINTLLQTTFSKEEIVMYLKRLEICSDGNTIFVPSFRTDLSTVSDIAMEIERIHRLT